MFEFLYMQGNYETRRVGRWDSDDGTKMVSTAAVNDGNHPYETAFEHPDYNDGEMVIVEAYDTKEAALKGHNKWVKIMTKGPLPKVLKDCKNSEISQMCGKLEFRRNKKRADAAP